VDQLCREGNLLAEYPGDENLESALKKVIGETSIEMQENLRGRRGHQFVQLTMG